MRKNYSNQSKTIHSSSPSNKVSVFERLNSITNNANKSCKVTLDCQHICKSSLHNAQKILNNINHPYIKEVFVMNRGQASKLKKKRKGAYNILSRVRSWDNIPVSEQIKKNVNKNPEVKKQLQNHNQCLFHNINPTYIKYQECLKKEEINKNECVRCHQKKSDETEKTAKVVHSQIKQGIQKQRSKTKIKNNRATINTRNTDNDNSNINDDVDDRRLKGIQHKNTFYQKNTTKQATIKSKDIKKKDIYKNQIKIFVDNEPKKNDHHYNNFQKSNKSKNINNNNNNNKLSNNSNNRKKNKWTQDDNQQIYHNKQILTIPTHQTISHPSYYPNNNTPKTTNNKLGIINILSLHINSQQPNPNSQQYRCKQNQISLNTIQHQNYMLCEEVEKYKNQCQLLQGQLRHTLETVKNITIELETANANKCNQRQLTTHHTQHTQLRQNNHRLLQQSIHPLINPITETQKKSNDTSNKSLNNKKNITLISTSNYFGTNQLNNNRDDTLNTNTNTATFDTTNKNMPRVIQTISPTIISKGSPRIIKLGTFCTKSCTSYCNCLVTAAYNQS